MGILYLFPTYIFWHYTHAIREFFTVGGNFFWFMFNFFSIDILLKTLFSPWRRLAKDESVRHPTFFSNLVINLLMRITGFLVRAVTIVMGLFSLAAAFLLFIFGFLAWIALPFLVVMIFLYGLSFLI